MCVPRENERICVFQVHVHACVCVLSKKRVLVFQLSAFMRLPQVNVYVCVHGCTSACAACSVSVVHICVFHVCAHVCLSWKCVSELPM